MSIRQTVDIVRSIYPHECPIQLHPPAYAHFAAEVVVKALREKEISTYGSCTSEFEKLFVNRFSTGANALALNSCTSALTLGLALLGVRPNDVVITTPLTYGATIYAAKAIGAKIWYVDTDNHGLMNLALVEDFLNSCEKRENDLYYEDSRISALMPVDILGLRQDRRRLTELAKKHSLAIVVDAAASLTIQNDIPDVKNYMECYSFNGNKIITTGSGGMLVSRNEELVDRGRRWAGGCKIAREGGFVGHGARFSNIRMPSFNAALGMSQLDALDRIVELKKNCIAAVYQKEFGKEKMLHELGMDTNHWMNALFVGDEIQDYLVSLTAEGILVRRFWEPLDQQCSTAGFAITPLVNSKYIASTYIQLPSGVPLSCQS
jgi:perosamine synthetase